MAKTLLQASNLIHSHTLQPSHVKAPKWNPAAGSPPEKVGQIEKCQIVINNAVDESVEMGGKLIWKTKW